MAKKKSPPKKARAKKAPPPPPASLEGGAQSPPVEETPPPEPTPKKELRAACVAKFRAELESDLRLAERDESQGPGGLGWLHNESKREEVTAWAEFLRGKLAELPAA